MHGLVLWLPLTLRTYKCTHIDVELSALKGEVRRREGEEERRGELFGGWWILNRL